MRRPEARRCEISPSTAEICASLVHMRDVSVEVNRSLARAGGRPLLNFVRLTGRRSVVIAACPVVLPDNDECFAIEVRREDEMFSSLSKWIRPRFAPSGLPECRGNIVGIQVVAHPVPPLEESPGVSDLVDDTLLIAWETGVVLALQANAALPGTLTADVRNATEIDHRPHPYTKVF
jgi:hypothetical protein